MQVKLATIFHIISRLWITEHNTSYCSDALTNCEVGASALPYLPVCCCAGPRDSWKDGLVAVTSLLAYVDSIISLFDVLLINFFPEFLFFHSHLYSIVKFIF